MQRPACLQLGDLGLSRPISTSAKDGIGWSNPDPSLKPVSLDPAGSARDEHGSQRDVCPRPLLCPAPWAHSALLQAPSLTGAGPQVLSQPSKASSSQVTNSRVSQPWRALFSLPSLGVRLLHQLLQEAFPDAWVESDCLP